METATSVRARLARLALPLAVLGLAAGCAKPAEPDAAKLPVAVETRLVVAGPLALTIELPGRIEPVRVAEVRARVAGIVLRRHFEEGADVRAGQVLFTIDPEPFEVALARARAASGSADAALAEAEGVARRYQTLVEARAVSQQDFEAARAARQRAASAGVAARADVRSAELNLQHATVRAPISGRIGRALVTEGALVGQNEATAMASIQQLDPIYADFTQPVADAVRLREAAAAGALSAQAKGAGAPLTLTLDGSSQRRAGRLLFADIAVDPGSGQVSLRGEFPNPDGLLLPGMYVRVTTGQGTDPRAILVPQRAVGRSTDGRPQVLVMTAGGLAEERLVDTGVMVGADWQIRSGLTPGDRVIVGRGAARPGDRVVEAAARAQP